MIACGSCRNWTHGISENEPLALLVGGGPSFSCPKCYLRSKSTPTETELHIADFVAKQDAAVNMAFVQRQADVWSEGQKDKP